MYGLMMDEQITSKAGITMPQSLAGSGNAGTNIKYGAGQYSNYNRTDKVFGWFVDEAAVLSAGKNAFYVNIDGSLKQVTVGAADSCGTGFKCLRIPN
jgi:hypothetical protein